MKAGVGNPTVGHWRSPRVPIDVKRLRPPAGFTLIELLVVVSVIAILATLLLPALSRATTLAWTTRCKGNVRQIGFALQMYVADNGAYPTMWLSPLDPVGSVPGQWKMDILPYVSRVSIGRDLFWCPAVKERRQRFFSDELEEADRGYGYNHFGYHAADPSLLGLGGVMDPSRKTARAVQRSEVVVPSGMIALGDNFHNGPNKTIIAGGSHLMRAENVVTTDSTQITRAWARMALRHDARANIAFCDGHVETPTNKRLFTDRSDEALALWNRDHLPHRPGW